MTGLYSFALVAVLMAIDQFTKYWALTTLKPVSSIPVVEGLLSWTYVENRGAAFGIFAGKTWLLLGVTACVICFLSYLLVAKKLHSNIEKVSISMILAGGAGNFLDRLTRGFVVDFIDINQLFSYPMFNFADCCVVLGAVAMVFYVFSQERKVKKGGNDTDGQHLPDSSES